MDIAHLIGDKTSQTLVMVQLTSTLLCFRPNQMFTTVSINELVLTVWLPDNITFLLLYQYRAFSN